MTSVKSSKILAAVLAVVLMLTLSAVNIFASDTVGEETVDAALLSAGADDAALLVANGDDDAAAPADNAADGSDVTDETEKEINWDLIISLSVIGLAVIVLVVLYFVLPKFREWVKKFCRDYKSELKKIVWSPWHDVKRNTLAVIVIVAASAIVIGVLDFIFSKGIIALGTMI